MIKTSFRDIKHKEINFLSDQLKLTGTAFYNQDNDRRPGFLLIHGSGVRSNRIGFIKMQEYLAKIGVNSLSFDSRGVGDSEGSYEDGGLKNRLTDAQNALSWGSTHKVLSEGQIGVVGFSMGTHIAVRLVELYPNIRCLALIGAVGYAEDAEDKPLNQEFSNIIRVENSWINSPVFEAFKEFKGKKRLIYGEYDPIPYKVREKYKAGLPDIEKEYIVIPNTSHAFIYGRTKEDREGILMLNSAVSDLAEESFS